MELGNIRDASVLEIPHFVRNYSFYLSNAAFGRNSHDLDLSFRAKRRISLLDVYIIMFPHPAPLQWKCKAVTCNLKL